MVHPDAAETLPTWMSDLLKVRFVTPAAMQCPGQAACGGSGVGYAGSTVHSGHGGIAEPALCSHTFSPGPRLCGVAVSLLPVPDAEPAARVMRKLRCPAQVGSGGRERRT